MFSFYMPYYDIRAALEEKINSGENFSRFELRSLTESMRNSFMQELIKLYPFPKQVMRRLEKALRENQRHNQQAPISLDVHNTLFDSHRTRVEQYLKNNFQKKSSINLMLRLECFVNESLQNKEVCDELILEEKDRAKKRKAVGSEQSLEEIKSDFQEYIGHLKIYHHSRSTYAWEILELLLNRLEALGSCADFDIGRVTLMRALDDSRTGYDGEAVQFVPGKNYSCLKGLEERLLDHHLDLAPTMKGSQHSQFIAELFAPYIMSLKDESGFHSKFWFTDKLYASYCRAAGYSYKTTQIELIAWETRLSQDDKQELKRRYLELVQHNDDLSEAKLRLEDARLNTIIRALEEKGVASHVYCANPFIEFLTAQNAVCKIQHQEEELVHDGVVRSDNEIIQLMLEQEITLGRIHLAIIFSIVSLDELRHFAASNLLILPEQQMMPLCSQERAMLVMKLHAAYENFKSLRRQHSPYSDLYYTLELEQALIHTENLRSMICPEELFIHFLKEKSQLMPIKKLEQYALLCVKIGYRAALRFLIQRCHVSPDLYCLQERKSLIQFACVQSDLETVKLLLSLGAHTTTPQAYQDNFFNEASQPIEIAYQNREFAIMQELISANASIDIKNHDGLTMLMQAIVARDIEGIYFFVRNGANLTATNQSGANLLHVALIDTFWEEIFLIPASARHADLSVIINCLINILREHGLLQSLTNMFDHDQYTPLMRAVENNNKSVVELLVEAGADLELKNPKGRDLVMIAAANGAVQVLTYLLELKSNLFITAVDDDNKNALILAAESGRIHIVEFLLQHPNTRSLRVEEFNALVFNLWLDSWTFGLVILTQYLEKNYNSLINNFDLDKKQTFNAALKGYRIESIKYFHEKFGVTRELIANQQLAGVSIGQYFNMMIAKRCDFDQLTALMKIIHHLIPLDDFEAHLQEASFASSEKQEIPMVSIQFATYTQRLLIEQELPVILSRLRGEREASEFEIENMACELIEKFDKRNFQHWPIAVFSLVMNDRELSQWHHQKDASALLLCLVEKALQRIQQVSEFDSRWADILEVSLDIFMGQGSFSHSGLNEFIVRSLNQTMMNLQIIYEVVLLKSLGSARKNSYFSLNTINIIGSMIMLFLERHSELPFSQKEIVALEKIIVILMDHLDAQKIPVTKLKGLIVACSKKFNIFVKILESKCSIQILSAVLDLFSDKMTALQRSQSAYQTHLHELNVFAEKEHNLEAMVVIKSQKYKRFLEDEINVAMQNDFLEPDELAQTIFESFIQKYGLISTSLGGMLVLIRANLLHTSIVTTHDIDSIFQILCEKALDQLLTIVRTNPLLADEVAYLKMMLEVFHSTHFQSVLLYEVCDEKLLSIFNKAALVYCEVFAKKSACSSDPVPEFTTLAKIFTLAIERPGRTIGFKKELIQSVDIGFQLMSVCQFQEALLIEPMGMLLKCVSGEDFCSQPDRRFMDTIYFKNKDYWILLVQKYINESQRAAYISTYTCQSFEVASDMIIEQTSRPLLLTTSNSNAGVMIASDMLDNVPQTPIDNKKKRRLEAQESSENKCRKFG